MLTGWSSERCHERAAAGPGIVMAGATGMVGGYALRCVIGHPAVGSVTAVGLYNRTSRTALRSRTRFPVRTQLRVDYPIAFARVL